MYAVPRCSLFGCSPPLTLCRRGAWPPSAHRTHCKTLSHLHRIEGYCDDDNCDCDAMMIYVNRKTRPRDTSPNTGMRGHSPKRHTAAAGTAADLRTLSTLFLSHMAGKAIAYLAHTHSAKKSRKTRHMPKCQCQYTPYYNSDSVTRRSSAGVAPRACARVCTRVLVPPNLYIHTYTYT